MRLQQSGVAIVINVVNASRIRSNNSMDCINIFKEASKPAPAAAGDLTFLVFIHSGTNPADAQGYRALLIHGHF